jgi:hypothetical protein
VKIECGEHLDERRRLGLAVIEALEHGLSLAGANLAGVILSGADLRVADFRAADLSSANLHGARLDGALLWRANLRGADLTSACLVGANLHHADLTCADITGSICHHTVFTLALFTGIEFGLPREPLTIPQLDAKILAALEAGGRLDMHNWHTCETTHCRAGWAITLAGEAGRELEKRYGVAAAGAIIYGLSRPYLPVPDFYADNDAAMADIRASAAAAASWQIDGSC